MPAPGVVVQTAVRSGSGTPVTAPSGQYFVVGLAERGPTTRPAKINSMADYRRVFGDRVSYGALFDDLSLFFETGGSQAHVLRRVGPAATVGLLVLKDRAVVASPAVPPDTLRIEAANPGSWSNRLTVEVTNGTNVDTYRLVIRLDGQVVDSANNLASPSAAVNRFATSPYVRVIDLGSATAPPANNPAVLAPTALSAGTDDRAAVTAAIMTSGLALFDVALGDGAVAIPGQGNAVHSELIAHARGNRRLALLDTTRGASITDLGSTASGLAAAAGAESAGLFAPYVLVSDGAGGSRAISPVGYVAAQRNNAHALGGPWVLPAGEVGRTPYLTGVDQVFTRADHELLDAARVNPIRLIGGSPRLYGWRSLSSDESGFGYLSVADLLNRLVTEAEDLLEPFVFRPIDPYGRLFAELSATLIGMLDPIRVASGIYPRIVDGDELDPGYVVDVGPAVNTAESLARNELRATISVRFAPSAALISLQIVKVGVNSGL